MSKNRFPWVLAGVVVAAWAGWHAAGLVVAGLVLAVAYAASIRLHPRARHTGFRGCGGTGEHHSALFPWTHRRCGGCASGRVIRFGARRWGTAAVRAEAARARRARARARETRAWR